MASELAYISSNTPVKLPHFSNISYLLGRSRAFYQHLLHQQLLHQHLPHQHLLLQHLPHQHLLRALHHLGCFQQS